MPVNETVILDLDQIVKSRFGEKKIPQFVLNWLKKFIHQDHLNGYLSKGYLGVSSLKNPLSITTPTSRWKGWKTFPTRVVSPSRATIRSADSMQ